jgi:hypothetical protein
MFTAGLVLVWIAIVGTAIGIGHPICVYFGWD